MCLSLLTSTFHLCTAGKNFNMKYPKVLTVLKFREDILDAMKREENLDDMATFSLQLLGLVCDRQQQQQQQLTS